MLSAVFYQPDESGVRECGWAAIIGGKVTVASTYPALADNLREASADLEGTEAEAFLRALTKKYDSSYLWAEVKES